MGCITLTLDDEGVTEETNKGVAHYCYDSFVDAYDYQDRWFLFLDKHHAFILPKEAMRAGDSEMLASFWEEKTGKTMIQIKSKKLHK